MKEKMLHITSLYDGVEIFKALGSDIRLKIIYLLLENRSMNMNELASLLNITNGALTGHIKKLEECGLITITSESAGHGNQKKCTVALDKILVDFGTEEKYNNIYHSSIKVGHYSDYNIYPTCGLSTSTAVIGEVDDVRYFAHPDKLDAQILWFSKGYVEYIIPNFIPKSQKIDQITLSFEISSEAPGVNEIWPSDIHFYLNDVCIGRWLSPGDFGDVKGLFTPEWWFSNWNQYGLLKLLVINRRGTFLDGLQVSEVCIDDFKFNYNSIIKFKLGIPEDAEYIGGLTLFGKAFGNYNQDIDVKIHYSSSEN